MDLSSFYNQFREETTENIRVLNNGLLALEDTTDTSSAETQDHLNAIFRAMHTVKGSARLLGFETISRLAHAMEHILSAARSGIRVIDRSLADELLRGGDAILELTSAAIDGTTTSIDVDQLIAIFEREEQIQATKDLVNHSVQPLPAQPADQQNPGAEQPTESLTPQQIAPIAKSPDPEHSPPATHSISAAAPVRPKARQTVRVRVDRLDRLINLTGELVVEQQVVITHAHTLHTLATLMQQHERTLLALETDCNPIQYAPDQRCALDEHMHTLLNSSNQIRQILNVQIEQFNQHVNQQRLLIGDLEQEVMEARLLPIATIFANTPRAVRELAHATNKDVVLELHGETTDMDRKLLEALSDPLLHLVRNAIDHGIEPPDERAALGKPRQGHVCISASAAGNEVHICIRDDGRGMDPGKLRDTAIRKQLISSEHAEILSDQEALELIFLPGFSTTKIITDISGRGVGMDVVRSNISELGGHITLESQLGLGTTITLVLPLTLVTTRILLVKVGNHTFAFPASGCRGTAWVYQRDIQAIEGQATIFYEEQTISLLNLADLIGVTTTPVFQNHERMPVVLVGTQQYALGLLVDQLLDEREAVIKSLGPLFEQRRRYSGAVQLGDGRLVLLLNPTILAQMARGIALSSLDRNASDKRRQAHLLVADDSFTTRELIRSILQSAGYIVTTAVDGFDALNKLRSQSYDLVISDIEMPRVNGFQLTSRIRQELELHDLPVIIMTSLASDEHRRQGLETGAQAYIVKSQFNQDTLLGVVQQLLDHEIDA